MKKNGSTSKVGRVSIGLLWGKVEILGGNGERKVSLRPTRSV